jgi:hypothetical protein
MSWNAPPPDPTSPDLLENLRAYLATQGVVRSPRTAGSLPPLWVAPRFGCPAPGQTDGLQTVEVGTDLVAAINPATDIPPARYEGWLRKNHIELIIRARIVPLALSFENAVRANINDRRGWIMGSVPIIESLLFRGLQPLGSDNLGYTFVCEYQFEIEGPYTPPEG